jgi:hypothetical protein
MKWAKVEKKGVTAGREYFYKKVSENKKCTIFALRF